MQALRDRLLALFKAAGHSKSPEAEADLILLHLFQKKNRKIKNFSDLRMESLIPDEEITEEALRLANARVQGIPLQHLLGIQYFYQHEYSVNDSTLIPRPETEILIDAILNWVRMYKGSLPFRFAELGIGSGILSTEILSEFKNARGVASEISSEAIALARHNLDRIVGPDFQDRLSILEPKDPTQGFEIFVGHGKFDLIISNPPYVSKSDEIEEEVLKHEPHRALFPELKAAQDEPNYFYDNFLLHFPLLLSPGGACFFEVPHERAEELLTRFKGAGFVTALLLPDLTGRSRVLQAGF